MDANDIEGDARWLTRTEKSGRSTMGVANRRSRPVDPRVSVVAVGSSDGRVRRVVVVRLRRMGASVSAPTLGGCASSGLLAGRGGGRGRVVGSTEWPIRAAAPPRANGPHHDARPLDRARNDGAADGVADRRSISLAHGVSFGLTESIEEAGGCRWTKCARTPPKRLGGAG